MSLWQAHFSPNGQWVSFVAHRTSEPNQLVLAIAPAAGTTEEGWTRLAADHRWPDKPRWSPDGRMLYFLTRRPTSYFNLWAVRFDPERGGPIGEPFALTRFDAPSLAISTEVGTMELGISDRRAVLSMSSVSGSIWMLDNVDR